MKKSTMYIFFDDVAKDYMNYYGKKWETILSEEFRKYLKDLSKNSKIMLITKQDISKVKYWLLKNELNQFIDIIVNPKI